MSTPADILVAGTGAVGLAAALSFADAGFSVSLAGPKVTGDDRRTTAIMSPGLDFLDALGLAETLKAEGAPLKALRIVDGTSRLVRSSPVLFRAGEIGEDAFGWNVPNAVLLRVLDDAAASRAEIDRHEHVVANWSLGESLVHATLSNGEVVSAKLAAAADGRTSPAREAAGISVRTTQLPQSALVLAFRHSRPHEFVSTEFHMESGPFTQVPLPGNRSSLVWVESPQRAAALLAREDGPLSEAVETTMHSMLGRVEVEPGRQVFPLSSIAPSAYAARRVALLGEAAHTIPPIGAQGLNLGLGDVRTLADAASRHRTDPGSPEVLDEFQRLRSTTIATRSAAVDLLNGSLLSPHLPAQLARKAGLAALRRSAPLRSFFMREGLEAGRGVDSRRKS